MKQIEEFVDERQKAWCIHCGQRITGLETNRDHVPSKSLLLKPHPENLPVVQVCRSCNAGFSLDEEYLVAFLSSVIAGSSDPERQANPNAGRILQRNPKLRARIEAARSEYRMLGGETRALWKPEPGRIDRVILKNARGHAFFEIGEPMLDQPEYVRSAPLEALTPEQRADFENMDFGSGWPEVGSRMMDPSADWAGLGGRLDHRTGRHIPVCRRPDRRNARKGCAFRVSGDGGLLAGLTPTSAPAAPINHEVRRAAATQVKDPDFTEL